MTERSPMGAGAPEGNVNALETLNDAIELAEGYLLEAGESRPTGDDLLVRFVACLRHRDLVGEPHQAIAQRLAHFAKLLSAIGLKQGSLTIADLTLRHMEISEADQEIYPAAVWNDLGMLLAEHGDVERSRLVLSCALNRARRSAAPELARILSNLSAVSLRADDLEDARIWAEQSVRAMGKYWSVDNPEARLTTDWVLLEIARIQQDQPAIGRALDDFSTSAEQFIRVKGSEHPRAIAALAALTAAKFEVAAASDDTDVSEQTLGDLETISLNASAILGSDHRQTIVTQASLAEAEFTAAEQGPTFDARRKRAVAMLETVADNASATLGRDHPQTREVRRKLAELRAAVTPAQELPYLIDQVYRPQQNTERNEAKKSALTRERSIIRLIAHAGASYFLSHVDLFYPAIIRALERHIHFHVVLSSPWNSLAVFSKRDATTEKANVQNIVDLVEDSQYYLETFLPVIQSYLRLQEQYGDLIELRLTPMDISGSTLLTTDMGFFEPYLTANPDFRTRRGLSAFEIRFSQSSRYYDDSVAAFNTQWELASTWGQFGAHEEQHKQILRDVVSALSDDKPGRAVKEGAERPR